MTPSQEKYQRRRLAFAEFIKLYPFTTDDLDGEEWRPIEGHSDYQISNFGRVKSFKIKTPRILKPALNKMNYLSVTVYKRNKREYLKIHRLVAEAFVPNPDNKPQVNHIDGCKINACASNLEWATANENMRHAVRTGLQQSGEDNYQAGVTNEQARYIRANPEKLTLKQLAKKFGVAFTKISDIQTGRTYKNAGGTIRKAQKYTARLPDETRDEIRRLYIKDSYQFGANALARKFGVSKKTILNIIHEK